MPLATASRKLADLEAHLKARLLHRSTRRLTLTDAGAAYLAACRRILDEVGDAERVATGEYRAPTGELIVTAPLVFGRMHVLPVAAGFLAAYPDVDAKLLLSDRALDLIADQVDVAVRVGELPDSRMVATPLGTIRRVVCASPAYLKRRGTPRSPAELAGHDAIEFLGPFGADPWAFGGQRRQAPLRARLAVNTAEAAIDAALAGVGVARVLSYQVVDAVAAGKLKLVLTKHEPPPLPVHLLYAGRARLPLKLRAFLDYAAPRLRARLGSRRAPR
jgi:DNA-binding transcriptional LysR family regulator